MAQHNGRLELQRTRAFAAGHTDDSDIERLKLIMVNRESVVGSKTLLCCTTTTEAPTCSYIVSLNWRYPQLSRRHRVDS